MKKLRIFSHKSPYSDASFGFKFYVQTLRSGKDSKKIYGITLFCGHRAVGILY